MATKIWNGTSGAFSNAASWSPSGVPVSGDVAIITAGTVAASGALSDGLTLALDASFQSSPVLQLQDTALLGGSTLTLNGTSTSAAVQLRGTVTNRGFISGTSTGNGSPLFLLYDGANGAATTFVNAGSISLAGNTQFLSFGTNRADGFENDGILAFAPTNGTQYTSTLAVPITGTGGISIAHGQSVTIVNTVSAGQTVSFNPAGTGAATLQLFDLPAFGATLSGFFASDSISLGQLSAPTLSYAATSATSGVLTVTDGPDSAGIKLSGAYKASDFTLQQVPQADGSVATVLGTTATAPVVKYTDVVTNTSGTAAPDLYSGPVSYLQYQYIWASPDAVALSTTQDNVFLKGNAGADALVVHGGSNVLDGGGGSNFLVGGTGADGGSDVFFVDGRSQVETWSSIVNFHHGDSVTVFGFTGGISTLPLIASDGAAGFTGATIHSELGGLGTGVNGSVTFAGVSFADAQDVSNGGKFTYSFSTVGGIPYMNIAYTG